MSVNVYIKIHRISIFYKNIVTYKGVFKGGRGVQGVQTPQNFQIFFGKVKEKW